VFLSNDITCPTGNRVETIVNQWPLMNPGSQLSQGSDWAALEGVGYWFPSGGDLRTSRETRSGTWAALGGSSDTTTHSKSFVSLWFDHGTSPAGAKAEYAIVPNVTASQMASWAASQPLTIIANDESVSAVRDNRTGARGLAFWHAGAVNGVSTDSAAVIYMTTTPATTEIWAADPNAGTTGSFKVTVSGYFTTKDVPFTQSARSTTITIPRSAGGTTHVVLTRVTKARAVRR
jgi:hyaluronate lyase